MKKNPVPHLIQYLEDADGSEEFYQRMKSGTFSELLPEVSRHLKHSEATSRLMEESIKETKQSRVIAPLASAIKAHSDLSDADLAKMYHQTTKKIRYLTARGEKGQRWKRIRSEAREKYRKSKRSGIQLEERRLTREWVRSVCEGGESGSTKLKCSLTRKKLYELYILIGAPHVYLSLLQLDKYQKKMKTFTPGSVNPKEYRGLNQSLYYVKEWTSKGWHTDRPLGIWARSERTFWKIIKERNGKKGQYLKICFSVKTHPCPLCSNYYETLEHVQCLTLLHNKAKKAQEKASIQARLAPLMTQLEALRNHVDKYEVQRKELQLLEKNLLSKDPGVVLVYEDFGSRYQADGTKMSNLILTLVYYNKKKNKLVIKYHDTFSRGSLPPTKINDPKIRGKQDKYLYRQVWLHKLDEGVFDRFHTIIKSGDNGGSLKNYETVWFAGMIWEKKHIRVMWHTLCPHHAFNRCDPHGGRTNQVMISAERRTKNPLRTAHAHAIALDEAKCKNTMPATALEVVPRKPDDYMPGNLNKKKPYEVYGIKSVCCMYPETPDIFDNQPNPQRTIRRTGKVMVSNVMKKKGEYNDVAYLDIRPDTSNPDKVCHACSRKFNHIVLQEEHDQSGYYLCPITNILATESDLTRECKLCEGPVGDKHVLGQKQNCPSIQDGSSSQFTEPHKTFPAITIHDAKKPVQLNIRYEAPPPLGREDIKDLMERYHKVMKPPPKPAEKVSFPLVETMFAVWKSTAPQAQMTLPWILGRCVKVNVQEKTYDMRVYKPDSDSLVPWDSTFSEAKESPNCLVPFGETLPVKMSMKSMKLSTKSLMEIALTDRYGWSLSAMLHKPQLQVEEAKETKREQTNWQTYVREVSDDEHSDSEHDDSAWDNGSKLKSKRSVKRSVGKKKSNAKETCQSENLNQHAPAPAPTRSSSRKRNIVNYYEAEDED